LIKLIIDMTDFNTLFEGFKNIKAGVIGDVMLDTYWWGHVERISPEAPVPVVTLDKCEYRIGGAGNVALNLASLGARTTLFSVIGEDEDGKKLKGFLEDQQIATGYLEKSAGRITTNKTRIISRNQQMMRLDSETTRDLTQEEEDRLLGQVKKYLDKEQPQVMIFQDYNKGVLTERLIREVIALCQQRQVVTAVDPKRKHFFSYRGVSIFKPNLKEVKEGLNLLLEEINLPVLEEIHRQLEAKLEHEISFITLSEKGVFFQEQGQAGAAELIPSHIRNIADVSGAGDTVIAVASLVYAATRDTRLMASIANIAGGLVCEEVGTVAVRKDLLLQECVALLK
jgi:D-glycero-beta-D-manno-heptose-7-phosphate kinase